MIKLSENAVMLLTPEGVMKQFDPEDLQIKLLKSFVASGIRENWMAEDIALAVEYALSNETREPKIFPETEVNALIAKILEETGFPQTAEAYRTNNCFRKITVTACTEAVEKILQTHLGYCGKALEGITAAVVKAAHGLDILEAEPTLYLELAKALQHKYTAVPSPIQFTPLLEKNSPLSVTSGEIIAALSPSAEKMINNKIISVYGVSRLFPALKLDFRLEPFILMLNLHPPLTEMAVIPHFASGAAVINECINAGLQLYRRNNSATTAMPPIVLNLPDVSRFATAMLDGQWPAAEPNCREMLQELTAQLDYRIFRLKIS